MFGQLGEIANLMKRLGDVKAKMQTMKEELSALEMSGRSSDGSVTVTMKGDMSCVTSVRITNRGPNLESAVREAVESALSQVRCESSKRLMEITGGVNIPGLM